MRAVLVALLLSVSASAQTGTIEGVVFEAETGLAVVGAAVRVDLGDLGGQRDVTYEVSVATDATGRFLIEAVPTGRHSVRAQALGYTRLDTTVTVLEGAVTTLEVSLRPTVLEGAEVVVQARRSETATRADAPVLLVPQSVAVVGASVLDGQNALDAQDALRNVPGVSVQVQGQPGGIPVLRGFATDQTGGGVRRNGVEVPYLSDGLQANVERVEVLRGPASVLYGRLEPGGVVNFITETPRDEQHVEAEVGGGTLGSGRVVLDAGAPVGTVTTRLNASLDQTGFDRDDVTSRTAFVAPAARWKPSPSLTLNLEGEAVAAETTIDPGLAGLGRTLSDLEAVPRDRFHGEPDAVHDWRSAGLFTNAEWSPSRSAAVRSGVSLARYRLKRDFLDLD
ncbi:TonB-dependent receptor plug domain-containing protein, partial [Rubrivirga sp.]|uniref:TonB-dependent receptor plug domain-containing protein n=1 Tax=Rubrivirga sp. TaxID=1885344 RepID=UPI003C716633